MRKGRRKRGLAGFLAGILLFGTLAGMGAGEVTAYGYGGREATEIEAFSGAGLSGIRDYGRGQTTEIVTFEKAETGVPESSSAPETQPPVEKPVDISTYKEFQQAYKLAQNRDVTVRLKADLIVTASELWGATAYKFTVITGEEPVKNAAVLPPSYHFLITGTGALKLANPNLTIKGQERVFVVEAGGSLETGPCQIKLYEDNKTAVFLQDGAVYIDGTGKGFICNGLVTKEETAPVPSTKPEETKPETEEYGKLTAEVLSADAENASIWLTMPDIPRDTEEVFIYYSENDEKWKKVYWEDKTIPGNTKEVENFVTEIKREPPYSHIAYLHLFEEYKWKDTIYLKVAVKGPAKSGETDSVEISLKDWNKTAGNTDGGSDGWSYSGTGSGGFHWGGYSITYGSGGQSYGSGGTYEKNDGAGNGNTGQNELPVIYFSETAPYWKQLAQGKTEGAHESQTAVAVSASKAGNKIHWRFRLWWEGFTKYIF